jgi:hypothetical protein
VTLIRRGEEFLSRYYAFKRPLSVKKEGDTWLLEFDVGVFAIDRVKLTIDATSGSIIGYADPRGI